MNSEAQTKPVSQRHKKQKSLRVTHLASLRRCSLSLGIYSVAPIPWLAFAASIRWRFPGQPERVRLMMAFLVLYVRDDSLEVRAAESKTAIPCLPLKENSVIVCKAGRHTFA